MVEILGNLMKWNTNSKIRGRGLKMNMTMTFEDFKGAFFLVNVIVVIWSIYTSRHSENKYIQTINCFWLGLMAYTVLFYIVFSLNIY